MAVDATNVAAGSPLVTGGIYAAPVGTTLPTTSDAALNVAFVGLGYAGESGVTPSGDEATTTDLKAWGGTVVASLTDTAAVKRYSFTLIEQYLARGQQVHLRLRQRRGHRRRWWAGHPARHRGQGHRARPLLHRLRHEVRPKQMRLVVPNGTVKILAERPYVDSDLTGWECEVTCLADSDGTYVYRYLEDDNPTA